MKFITVLAVLVILTQVGGIFLVKSDCNTSIITVTDQHDCFDLLLICPELYQENLQPFIEHKQSMDIQTLLITTETIYETYNGRDDSEKIKYCIKTIYENYCIDYVLFVGGIDSIPTRYTHVYYSGDFGYPTPSQWVFASDYYYADLYESNGTFSSWDTNQNDVFAEYDWDGNFDRIDYTPDVFIGRLPCVTLDEVSTCVQKIILYEAEKAWTQSWFNSLVCIGGDSLPWDDEAIDEGEYVQQHVIEILQGFIPEKVWASTNQLTSSHNINDAINEGAGFVFFNGHGLHNMWATHPHNSNTWIPRGSYTLADIDELENEDRLPIIISDACYHCQYDVHSDCFAWSFVRNPNGGAIAFIGGSDTDLAYGGTAIIQKGIERLCLEISREYMNGTLYLGRLIGEAISVYTSNEMHEIDMLTVLQNHLFGDPSLQISGSSHPPETPQPPSGPVSGQVKSMYTYTASTNDSDGDNLYYLFDWGDSSTCEWIGPYDSGAVCTVEHSWDAEGVFEVKVRAKDVHGVQSGWSDPVEITMPKTRCLFFEKHKLLSCFLFLFDQYIDFLNYNGV